MLTLHTGKHRDIAYRKTLQTYDNIKHRTLHVFEKDSSPTILAKENISQ